MFYSQLVLAKKGPLGKIWLAAHMDKKVPKLQIIQTNIPESVQSIQNPSVPMALRVSGHLLLGVVRVFSRKVTYLLTDCSEALVKIKDAFRAPGGVELAPGAGTKNYEEITRHEQFEDEMDLDADLASQLFATDEDDALAGIAIPDAPDELYPADVDADPAAEEEAEEGFGANNNFEVFFEPPDAEEAAAGKASRKARGAAPAPEDDEPTSKRRRRADEAFADEDEDEALPEMEVERADGAAGGMSGLADAPFDDGLGELGADEQMGAAPPEFEEAFEEEFPADEEPLGGPSAIEGVMEDELPAERPARSSASKAAPKPAEADGAAEQQQKKGRAPKRKMLIDDETQITTERIRKNLSDTTAIVRDMAAEEAAHDADAARSSSGRGRTSSSPSDDPIFGPPSLPYLPSSVATMALFASLRRPAKKARRDEKLPAPKHAKGATPRAHDNAQAPLEPDEPEEAWRSAHVEDELGGPSAAAHAADDPLAHSAAADEHAAAPARPEFGEFDEFDEPFLDEMGEAPLHEAEEGAGRGGSHAGVADERDEEAEEDVQAAAGFDPSRELPDVDGNDGAEAEGGGGKGGASGARHGTADPAAWNSRTRKMYTMLKGAYEESKDEALSYNAMVAGTKSSAHKRKVVAGCFQELLFLATHGMIELQQAKPYGNILVGKTELFDTVAAP